MSPSIPPTRAATPLPEALLQQFDRPGPRYTSYPTADRFTEAFGSAEAGRAMSQRARHAGGIQGDPLSVYVHVPFCESVCYYCACNKIVTRQHGRAAAYLDTLDDEIALVLDRLGPGQPVSQLHVGGGTPTFLSDAELQRLMASLGRAFRQLPDAEVSIEVDPRTVTPARLAHLREIGFNRISFGVQDIEPDVQRAVHRLQPVENVAALIDSARALGFESINADLIYGLPRQTPESFARTVTRIAELRPDRIALYAYAHLPERFKPQRRIPDAELPAPAQRVAMLAGAIDGFAARGYAYIGMDHFALHDDALAVAKRNGRLHRNFQGYSTQPDCDLIGLGVSAIGRIGDSYYQNAKSLPEYVALVGQRRLPVVRGIAASRDDVVRRDVIMALMCQGHLAFASIERTHGVRMAAYFADELQRLLPLARAGLVVLEPAAIRVTEAGWQLVRAVAMVFDGHLQPAPAESGEPGEPRGARFSRIV